MGENIAVTKRPPSRHTRIREQPAVIFLLVHLLPAISMSAFRLYEEKPTSPIHIMKWNPRIDLNAVALCNDEVWLHRLVDWQKVWSLSLVVRSQSAPKPKSKKRQDPVICDIEWRPDGKILAVGYTKDIVNQADAGIRTHSSIALIEIETSEVVHVIDLPNQMLTCLCWSSRGKEEAGVPEEYSNTLLRDGLIPPLKGLARINTRQSTPSIAMRKLTDENLTDLMKVRSTSALNILAAGTRAGHVFLYALGLLPVRQIRVSEQESSSCCVHSVGLSGNLSGVNVVHETGDGDFQITTFSLPVIERNCAKILVVSLIYAEILSFIRYMKDAISLMLEIWEDINLEIETKLSMYFKKSDAWEGKTPSSDEFMELLVFGNPSESLEKFLRDLGEKGLKKLGHSIDMTYTSVQKIVVTNLHRVSYHLIFHLNHLKGLALWAEEFHEVGINWTQVQVAVESCGSFLMKVIEFQQVIDTSIRSVKAFFRWLFTVIYRLYGDAGSAVPSSTSETIKISQQDLQLVAEFIEENFEPGPSGDSRSDAGSSSADEGGTSSVKKRSTNEDAGGSGKRESIFTLDRVGQYLQDGELCFDSPAQNCWIKFLNDRPGFPYPLSTDSTSLFPHERSNSLIREHARLVACLMQAFQEIEKEVNHQDSAFRTTLFMCNDSSPSSTQSTGSSGETSGVKRGKKILATHVTSVPESCFYTVICPLSASSSDPDGGATRAEFGEGIFVLKYCMMDGGGFADASATRVRFTEEADPASALLPTKGEDEVQLRVVDLQFYDSDSLFVLLGDGTGSRYMAQVPIPLLIEGSKLLTADLLESVEWANTIELSNGSGDGIIHYRKMHGVNWNSIAVSGARRVAAIASRRKIKIYETDMDFDEDDEDIDEESASEQKHDSGQVSIIE